MAPRTGLALVLLWLGAAAAASAQDVYKPADPSVEALPATPAPAPSTTSAAPSTSYVQRPGPQCADFKRAADGGWTVVQAIVFPAPAGPLRLDAGASFRSGQSVGGYDLGSMLQRDCPSG